MSKTKKQEHIPKHGMIRCKGHAPKHLPSEGKKERAGWWMLFSAVVYIAAFLLCRYILPMYIFLPVGIALLIFSLMKVTKKGTFPGIASLVISALGILCNLLYLWYICVMIVAYYI